MYKKEKVETDADIYYCDKCKKKIGKYDEKIVIENVVWGQCCPTKIEFSMCHDCRKELIKSIDPNNHWLRYCKD